MNLFRRAFALFALVALPSLGACSGASQGSLAMPISAPASVVGSGGLTAGYRCFTPGVFKPWWSAHFGAINSAGAIPGSYSPIAGERFNFIIRRPYKQFRGEPGQGATITAVTHDRTILGYIVNPPELRGVWGFIRIGAGVWTLFTDPKEGSGDNAVTEILGANDRARIVGFYMNRRGKQIAFAAGSANEKFIDLNPPGSTGAYATGINEKDVVVGTATTSAGTVGFVRRHGDYTEFSYPGSTRTEALGINLHGEIVGDYTDASGSTHGFFLTDPANDPHWRSFDEPFALGYTVLTGINAHGDFDGNYINQAGIERPFLCNVSR